MSPALILGNYNTMNTQANSNVTHTEVAAATAQAAGQSQVVDGVDVNAFRPYDSQLPVPALAGYRIVKCLYKRNPKTGTQAADNSYIRVPAHITEEVVAARISELAPYLVSYLQAEEDKLIKERHTAGLDKLSPDFLTLDRIIAALETSGVSNRLNKEAIEAWFAESMHDALLVAFADKMDVSDTPTAEQTEKLDSILSVYRAKFGSLASGKTHYRVEEAEMLLKALEITGAGDSLIGGKFVARLTKMMSSTPTDLLLAL